MRSELVVDALQMAVTRRRPAPGLIHHTDQGSQGGFNRSSRRLIKRSGARVCEIARQLGRSPSMISRELRRNAATRGGVLEYRATTAQWHADRWSRRPWLAKLAVNAELRADVQDRLAGVVQRPDGIAVDGPVVLWRGRRHGRRKDRRWARSWSPEQISNAACGLPR